jgi:hypothetical protein
MEIEYYYKNKKFKDEGQIIRVTNFSFGYGAVLG